MAPTVTRFCHGNSFRDVSSTTWFLSGEPADTNDRHSLHAGQERNILADRDSVKLLAHNTAYH